MNEPNLNQTAKIRQAEFVVPHTEAMGLRFVTIVRAKIAGEELAADGVFLESRRRAITGWINRTKRGREAWRESCEDFNIGDLGGEFPLGRNIDPITGSRRNFKS